MQHVAGVHQHHCITATSRAPGNPRGTFFWRGIKGLGLNAVPGDFCAVGPTHTDRVGLGPTHTDRLVCQSMRGLVIPC